MNVGHATLARQLALMLIHGSPLEEHHLKDERFTSSLAEMLKNLLMTPPAKIETIAFGMRFVNSDGEIGYMEALLGDGQMLEFITSALATNVVLSKAVGNGDVPGSDPFSAMLAILEAASNKPS